MNGQHFLPLLKWEILYGMNNLDTCIAYHCVNTPPFFMDFLKTFVHSLFIRYIHINRNSFTAGFRDLVRSFFSGVFSKVANRNFCAIFYKIIGYSFAYTACGSGYNCD